MSISVSDLYPHQTNHIEGYDRLYHTRRYFNSKAVEVPRFKKRLIGTRYDEIREYCGYSNILRFLEHVKEWNILRVPIPVKYLEAIEIDFKTLEYCVELDREDYLQKLNGPRYPKTVNVRSGPVILSYDLPDYDEHEAISYVRNEIKGCAFIIYEDFLTIELSGDVPTYYYHLPGLFRKGDSYSFTDIRTSI